MSNWGKPEDDSMWIPTRPSAASGDRYNKHKRKDKRGNSDSFAMNNNRSQTHRPYSHSTYNNHHNHNNYNNNNYAPNPYNDTKRVIIAKKKSYSSNADINDSFNSTNLDEKRQREQQRFLMQQHLNSEEAKLADYKHKQQRYSQIKNEFGLSGNKNNHTQSRIMNKPAANTQSTSNATAFKVLQRDNGTGTKIAILDLVGNINDDELYAELDRKAKATTPLKPVRPPIPTPHSQSVRSTPTNSVPSQQTKSPPDSTPIRSVTPKTAQQTTPKTTATVKLPQVQPKPKPVDSEELEQSQRNKMRKQKNNEDATQFKGGFVPHGSESNKYEYDHVEQQDVKKIINDVRQLDFNNNTTNDVANDNTRNNHRNYSRYNTKNNHNDGQNYRDKGSKRQYQQRRNQNSDRYYRQSRSRNNEFYDNNDGYNDYYARNQNNDDYYGRSRKRGSYRSNNNNNDSYNKAYRDNDSRYYNSRSNRKY